MARGRRSGRPADYFWTGICGLITALDLAPGASALGSARIDSIESQTLMRIRGDLFVQLDATAADERATVAIGLIIVKTAAAAVGSSAVPTPFTEPSASWIWMTYVTVSSLAEAAAQPDALFARVVIDSKSMRRIKADESCILVAEVCNSIDQGGTFDIMFGLRSLSAL